MSLRAKVLLPLLLFSMALLAYLYAYWMPRSLANIEAGFQRSLETHLDSVDEGLIPLLLGRQLDVVYENLDRLMKKNRDWIEIRLLDAEGKMLYPLAPPPATKPAPPGTDPRLIERRIRLLDTDLGSLALRVDFAPRLSAMRRRHWELMSVVLGGILIFTVATGFALDRLVVRPVKLLSHASRKLAADDFDVPLTRVGGDEVGTLVNDFVGMRTAMREYRSHLRNAHEQLQLELAGRRKHEKALSEQSRLLEAFFENSMTLNVILDRDFNFIRVNEAYARADNRRPADFAGRNHFELYPSDAKAIFDEVVATAQSTRVYARPFVYADHPERGVTYWDWTLAPLTDETGRVNLLIFSLNNVTRQQQARESLKVSEARLREAQQIAKIGNWDWDVLRNVLWWSDETYRILGVKPGEFSADFEAFIRAIHPEDRERVERSVQKALREGIASWDIDYRVLLPDGTVRFVHEEAKTIHDATGKPLRRVGTVQDVTERKQAERELRSYHGRLEELVQERTAELEAKNRELGKMNRLFVGRELRMRELKERIKELEAGSKGKERLAT